MTTARPVNTGSYRLVRLGDADFKGQRNRKLENSKYKEAKASPGFLFWKRFNSWQRLIRERLEPLGLTQVQYAILAATSYLESAEHVTQQNVSDQLSMDKMMVSDLVKTLEKRNLLTRTKSKYELISA